MDVNGRVSKTRGARLRWHQQPQLVSASWGAILFVTFLSPNVGGHDSPLKGSRFHHPNKVMA